MKRILFVDDHPSVLAGVCNSLRSRRAEWEPVLALDADDAREQLAKQRFHAIVCDIHMPGDDGEALLREMLAEVSADPAHRPDRRLPFRTRLSGWRASATRCWRSPARPICCSRPWTG